MNRRFPKIPTPLVVDRRISSSRPAGDVRLVGRVSMNGAWLVLFLSAFALARAVGAQLELAPPIGSGQFGKSVSILPNGNIVVTDPYYDAPGPILDVGAVHLYHGVSLQLISTLTGSSAGDRVGWSAPVILANGSFVVGSPHWSNSRGAATWVDPITGLNGIVTQSNSIVGSTSFDSVGNQILVLTNGHYLVVSPQWDNRGVQEAGAVTWCRGDGGTWGAISETNSLVGSYPFDQVGMVTLLANGNYVIRSSWNDERGAVTWGNGAIGVRGRISATNSLVGNLAYDPSFGSTADSVGSGGVTALSNGNYVVASPNWTGILLSPNSLGAVTWGNGSSGVTGLVSVANSLIGAGLNDAIGSDGVTALANGNYVVRSPWSYQGDGAVTWGDGTLGVRGQVSSLNSLVGYGLGTDHVGRGGIVALPNGNYVVLSPDWSDLQSNDQSGAVTWADGRIGLKGFVSAENSLVGERFDWVGGGGVTVLPNANYVVISDRWNGSRGAVTWCNGGTGRRGFISESNSLVGGIERDWIGVNGIRVLANGNFVVESPSWHADSGSGVGAVTWGNGRDGVFGVVSPLNSLVGARANDFVGRVSVLSNGHYVVTSPNWDNGPIVNAGAVTWGNGEGGTTGLVSVVNSLVGHQANDQVGFGGAQALANGNYVVRSPLWDNGTTSNVGAVTWANGGVVVTGAVSAVNSLIGQSANDWLGTNEVLVLPDGNYVVRAPDWDNGTLVDAGAIGWANGSNGLTGFISAENSLVGKTANERIGGQRLVALPDGGYVALNARANNGAGAVTLGEFNGGTQGFISAANSVLTPVIASGATNATVISYDSKNSRLLVGVPSANRVSLIAYPVLLAGRLNRRLITFPNAYQLVFGEDDGPAERAVYARATGGAPPSLSLVDGTSGTALFTRSETGDDGVQWLLFTNLTGVNHEIRIADVAGSVGAGVDLALYRVIRPGAVVIGQLSANDFWTTNRAAAVGSGRWHYDEFLLRGVQPGNRISIRTTSLAFNPFIEIRLVSDESVLQYDDGSAADLMVQGVAGRARDYLIRVTTRESGALGAYNLFVDNRSLVPEIRGFQPAAGTPGTRVAVRGVSFIDGQQPVFDAVTIAGVGAPSFEPIIRGSEQEFELQVPDDARTGPIRLHRGQETLAASGGDFVVLAPVGSVRREQAGRMSFAITNLTAGIFVVEGATNLSLPVAWRGLQTNAGSSLGPWRYTNEVDRSKAQQFFRVKVQ